MEPTYEEILALATKVFGSAEDAQAWMKRPAIGLNQQRPIELTGTAEGREAVATYLVRIYFGVYT
ncbi:MbcA/ParS/Xre antitoxin family protein [Parvibaculum sp.]|uniref:MbcA/ParS/Xre antitoxin family protein n=1 Tax=Parvibaculum sp. TaxID=2024848 RepID=UPI0025E4971A|nr:MbcA/ParS/Xre antitoxin family protein [Parvibaculum sp.]